jgi:hypothetical protein
VSLGVLVGLASSAEAFSATAFWGIYRKSDNSAVRGKRSQTASDVSSEQDFHGVLLKTGSSCSYDVNQYQAYNDVYNNIQNTPVHTTSYVGSSSGQRWIHAGGHHWLYNGVDWTVDTADTNCMTTSSMVIG